MSEIRIGISGWRYRPWRKDFYPKGLRPDKVHTPYDARRLLEKLKLDYDQLTETGVEPEVER